MSARAAIARSAVAATALALAACGRGADLPAALQVRVADHDATAFAVGDGRAVTVAHVLQPGRPVLVGGRRARVLRVDRRLDVALLAVPGLRGSGERGAARAGEAATVRVPRGTLRARVRRTVSARIGGFTRPALELATAVMPGDSGAPVVDADGRVVGVLFAQATDRDLAYAVDARALAGLR
jgi:S1-C subfamily serine protease